jgi:poly(3-hydroxybutyrate) depolymerase
MKIASRSAFRSTFGFRCVVLLLLSGLGVEGSFTHDPNDGVLWNATYGIDVNESIGQARFYHIRVPVSLPLDDFLLMPLVIQLHGGGGNASNFEQTTKLGDAAAARGYIVVYGEGIDNEPPNGVRTWNAGSCCGAIADAASPPELFDTDDSNYLRAVLADLTARGIPYNSSRVFATGHSNGAFMAYRAACELEGPGLAGIAVSAGSWGYIDGTSCLDRAADDSHWVWNGTKNESCGEPQWETDLPQWFACVAGNKTIKFPSVLAFQGMKDEHMYYGGGSGNEAKAINSYTVPYPPFAWAVDRSAALAKRCDAASMDRVVTFTNSSGGNSSEDTTTCETYVGSGCVGHANVTRCISASNGHTWPGSSLPQCDVSDPAYSLEKCALLIWDLGGTTSTISATDAALSFFDLVP